MTYRMFQLYNYVHYRPCRWPDIFRMKMGDKNFGIETPGETVYFKMVRPINY